MENKETIEDIERSVKEKLKKIRQINIRLSEEEFERLIVLENETGSNRTNLFRAIVLNDSHKIFVNAKELLKSLNIISGELGRSGNNINQLAKYANTLNKNLNVPIDVVADFNRQMANYILIEQDLHQIYRHIYRLMRK